MNFFLNGEIREQIGLTESKLKEELIDNLNSIIKSDAKKLLFKIFAYTLIDTKSTGRKYNKGLQELSDIVVKNKDLFSRLYIFSVDGQVVDIFGVGSILKQILDQEDLKKDVIETLYPDPDALIKNLDSSYNEWYEFFNFFKSDMAEKYKDFIVVDFNGYVYIPVFWEYKIHELFYTKYREYLELLAYLSQSENIDRFYMEFCDLLMSEKNICKRPDNSDKFLERYYSYSDIIKGTTPDDLRIKYEPIVKEFIKEKLSEEDIKTYYHLQLIDKLNSINGIKEDKKTVIKRFFDSSNISRLKSLNFLNLKDGGTFIVPEASSGVINLIIGEIYPFTRFEEELKNELNNKFSKLSEKEKALLCLIISPESVDSGIRIALKDTSRLFPTQVLNANISGERFEKLKDDFYIVKTTEGYESSLKEHMRDIFDEIDLENLPYVLFDRSKEETKEYIDKIFKHKTPSYFYRLLNGELTEDETSELQKSGLILSDGCNHPIVHPNLKDVFKEKWSEHWNNIDKIIGKNVIKVSENQKIKEFAMKCNIETYTIYAAPYMNIEDIYNDAIRIKIVNKDLGLEDLLLSPIDFEHTILISEDLTLNRLNPKDDSGKKALLNGLTVIGLERGEIISANVFWDEIAQTVETSTQKEIRVPHEYFSILHELQEEVKRKREIELHEKAKKALTEKTKEERELEKIDELWQKIFLREDEIILFEPDKYLNGKLKTFTFLVHGLPGCGKTTLIENQAKLLKKRIEQKLNWKTPILHLSIKKVLDYRASAVDYCHTFFSEVLREFKPSKDEKGRPGIIIIQDLDALAEQKLGPTSDVREGQKIGLIIKDFLKEIFEKQEYQLAVFAEATNINNVPDYLLQFFPNRKVVLAPSIDEREKLFDRVRIETIEQHLKGNNPELVKELIDIIGLPIKKEHAKILSQHTQGFTYRDLVVVIRDLKQNINIKGEVGERDIIKLIRKYEPSLPQYLRIEVPKVDWDRDVINLSEQKQKVKDALLIKDGEKDVEKELTITPAKGLLFYGVPGTGKTYLAKAIANKCNAYFIHLSPPQIFSKYFGESERNLKHIFTIAKELASYGGNNVIIFIDELDGFAPSREKMESRPERSVLSVFLSELDGLEELKGVTVIGTTNRPQDIDPALIRSGRFDEWIEFKPPDFSTCVKIFYSSLKKYLGNDVPDYKHIEDVLKEIEDKTYNPKRDTEQNYNDLLVPADLSSFAQRISRIYLMNKDKDLLKLIKEELGNILREKEQREKWLKKQE